jgi:hypothetical protein
MNTELNKNTVRIGFFLKIITISKTYRYQNFVFDSQASWNNETYEFAPIDYTPPGRSLDLDNNSTKVTLPNYPEILSALEQNDGFRDAIVSAVCVFPDNSNSTPFALDLMMVRSSNVQEASITFELQSPFSAVSASFPSIYFTSGNSPSGNEIIGNIPQVPMNARSDIN